VSTGGPDAPAPGGDAFAGVYFDPREKLRTLPGLFAHLRAALGDEVELLYDVHERLEPIEAVALAKALEPYRLFFLEDVVAPEDLEWLAMLRAQTCTPIAIGELFNHPHEMTPFIQRRLLDFIRVHVSQIGGVTPAIKLAHLCAAFGVRTAWHGPGDVSPVGMAANVHLDLALHNFGIQEWGVRAEVEYEMFPGLPELRGGCVDANGRPGWGIEFREDVAARYPCDDEEPEWTRARRPDGTVSRP
jgi:mannonate dehydratase